MNTKLHLVFSITILFLSFYGSAQSNYWNRESNSTSVSTGSLDRSTLKKAALFSLDTKEFDAALRRGPQMRNSFSTVYFPDENGNLQAFEVRERSIMSPRLSDKYPEIKSYVGRGKNVLGDRIRFSVSPFGIQSMIVHANGKGTTFMQKSAKDGDGYIVYKRNPASKADGDFICATTGALSKGISSQSLKMVDDGVLRKFRVAISATGEYTQYHGGTEVGALSAINATLTRVNEVMETDLGVSLQLVDNNDLLIYTSANSDPYNGNLNGQVQSTLTSIIGEANYDLGHLFHRDTNNGNAGSIGSVCVDNKKGSAFSSALDPEGDLYDLDFVAHEMGHQFGANHTWSFESEEDTFVQAEPGSGTTIMGYAGISDANNVASNGDDYYHYYSIFQISEYLETVSCAEVIPVDNTAPVITPIRDFIIPKSTAFVLTGNASDVDLEDVLTYTWEQIDQGVVTNTTFGPTNPSGANFRSQPPSLLPQRYFPQLSRVLEGELTQENPTLNSAWETVSDVERDMNFALTVRDNSAGGGQVSSELLTVSVVNAAGPFVLLSQAENEIYEAGSVQQVVWDVANTNRAPVNAMTVDILLSLDGGQTFPLTLATEVPNTGTYEVLLPGAATVDARIMVKAHDNIFFAVNADPFTITATEMVLRFGALEYRVCQPDDLLLPFMYETYLGFSEEATFSVTGLPPDFSISLSETVVSTNTSVVLTIGNTIGAEPGFYPFQVRATAGSTIQEVPLGLYVQDGVFSEVVLLSPSNNQGDVLASSQLEWEQTPSAESYGLEISEAADFSAIIDSITTIFNSYSLSALQPDTTYYWRVRAINECGQGNFGAPFSFTTKAVSCSGMEAQGLPLAISTVGTPTITSKIVFLEDLPVADINVNLDVTHSYLEDLVISLSSPAGTKVVLLSSSCGSLRNINATFDDEGDAFGCDGNPAISGAIQPLGSLAAFKGESLLGEWTLEIKDNQLSDGGSLNDFSMEVCVQGTFRPDADGDGVFDDGDDLCLGTPKGLDVDVNGCAVYRFPADRFTVEVGSESCRDRNNGWLAIEATEAMDYNVSVIGNGINVADEFSQSYNLGSMGAGTYEVCIGGTSGTIVFEQYCFQVTVTQPDQLNVIAELSTVRDQISLQLGGGHLYNVELNGIVRQTSASGISLQLERGNNVLKVSTNIACQGSYEERFFVLDGRPMVFPNPVTATATLFLGADTDNLQLAIYTIYGQLVRREQLVVEASEVELDFGGMSPGVYLVSYKGDLMEGTYKVIKK